MSGEKNPLDEQESLNLFRDMGDEAVDYDADEDYDSDERHFAMKMSQDLINEAVEDFDEEVGGFNVKGFEAELLPGETEEDRGNRYRSSQERRMLVAFSAGEEALLKPDFDFNGSNEIERRQLAQEVADRYEKVGGMSEEKFLSEAGAVLEKIETPMTEEGAGAVYDKLKDDNLALRLVYALTAEDAWTAEEGRADLDAEGQKQLGTRVLGAFFGKYGNAAEFRKAEKEFLEAVKDVPEYQEAIKNGKMNESLDNLAWEMYGEQEEWMEVAESVRENGQKIKENRDLARKLEEEELTILDGISGLTDGERRAALGAATNGRVEVDDGETGLSDEIDGNTEGEAVVEKDGAEVDRDRVVEAGDDGTSGVLSVRGAGEGSDVVIDERKKNEEHGKSREDEAAYATKNVEEDEIAGESGAEIPIYNYDDMSKMNVDMSVEWIPMSYGTYGRQKGLRRSKSFESIRGTSEEEDYEEAYARLRRTGLI